MSKNCRWPGVIIAALVLALAWSAASASGRTARVQIPRLQGDVITVYNRLHRLGLRVSIPKAIVFNSMNPPQVVATVPRAGRRVRPGAIVTLVLSHRAAATVAAKGRLPAYRGSAARRGRRRRRLRLGQA